MTAIVCVSRYGDTWYLTGKRSARFKCFEASKISIPMIRLSAPMSSTTSSVERLFMTSCLRSSNRMYTRSALGLYRISIVDLPFPVKDVDGYGNYNISFDSEKDFDFFLLVDSAQARLVKVKDFALAQTAVLCGNWTSAVDDVYDLLWEKSDAQHIAETIFEFLLRQSKI